MTRRVERLCASCGRPIDPDGYVRVTIQSVHDGLREVNGRAFRRPEAHMVRPRMLLCRECAGKFVEAVEREVSA